MQIVDIGEVYMTFLPRYFVNADMSDAAEIPMLQAIINYHLDSGGNCSPGAVKQLGNGVSGKHPGPASHEAGKSRCKTMLAGDPGKFFNSNPLTRRTIHPARLIMQPDWNIPKRNMTKKTNIPTVSVSGRRTARSATNAIPVIGTNFGNKPLPLLGD